MNFKHSILIFLVGWLGDTVDALINPIARAYSTALRLSSVRNSKSYNSSNKMSGQKRSPPQQNSGINDDGDDDTDGLSRRRAIQQGLRVSAVAAGLSIAAAVAEVKPTDYGLWGILPVGTYKSKPTVKETIVPGQLWTLEQKFGILNVQVPLRMTVVRIGQDGLLVYNPIAATRECVQYLRDIMAETGCIIKDIVVGSVALEHKVYAGVLAQKFHQAQVWLTPGQYAFPTNLPESFLGFPLGRTRMIPTSKLDAPLRWQNDLDWATLGPIISKDGAFAETVLLHKPTKSLIVTDTAVQVTDDIPPTYQTDPSPLLYHARDTVTDVVKPTPETLRKGWRRVVLFGLYFNPAAITIKELDVALRERRPDINGDFLGVYPWDWVGDEEASWRALTGSAPGGKPLVAPILQTLLLNRSPVEVLDFADKVAAWDFDRIIPAHLKNNLRFTGKDYRAAFGFLEESGVPPGFPKPLPADLQALLDAEVELIRSGAIVPAPPKVGGSFSREEIIAKTVYRCRAGVCAPKATAT